MCANDFGTYANECELSKYACEAYDESDLASVAIEHEGQCKGERLVFFYDMQYSIFLIGLLTVKVK